MIPRLQCISHYDLDHFKVTVFGAVLKSSTVFPFASRSDLSVLAGKSALSVMEEGASIK